MKLGDSPTVKCVFHRVLPIELKHLKSVKDKLNDQNGDFTNKLGDLN